MGPDIEWNKSSFDFIYLFTPKPNSFLAKALKEEIHAFGTITIGFWNSDLHRLISLI